MSTIFGFSGSYGSTPIVINNGSETSVSAFNDNIAVKITPVIQLSFAYGLNTGLLKSTVTGSGSVSSVSSVARVSTGTTLNSTALLESKKICKYYGGFGFLARFTAVFPPVSGTAGQYIGLGGGTVNGLFFGRDSAGMYINHRNNSVDNKYYQNEWNNRLSQDQYSPEFGNVYQIRFAYLGYGCITFYVMGKTGKFVEVHKIQYPSSSVSTSLTCPHLKLMMYITNGDSAQNFSFDSGSMAAFIEGEINRLASSVRSDFSASLTGSGTNVHLLTIRCRAVFNGITNFLTAYLNSLSMSVDGTKNTKVTVLKDAVVTGLTFSNYNTSNSIMESSATGSYSSGGSMILSLNLGKVGNTILQIDDHEDVYLSPGESFTFLYTTTASTTVDIAMTLLEDV
jgi:hypothetical protein